MIETIKTFIAQHKAAVTDFSFIAGYLLFIIAATILVLFFGLRYIRARQTPDEKTIKGFTKDSLLLLLDYLTFITFFYIGHTIGIKTGLNEKLTLFFDTFPPFLYSLMFIPFMFFAFFAAEYLNDRFLYKKMNQGIRYLRGRMKKRGDRNDDTESTDIPDVHSRDSCGSYVDDRIYYD